MFTGIYVALFAGTCLSWILLIILVAIRISKRIEYEEDDDESKPQREWL